MSCEYWVFGISQIHHCQLLIRTGDGDFIVRPLPGPEAELFVGKALQLEGLVDGPFETLVGMRVSTSLDEGDGWFECV